MWWLLVGIFAGWFLASVTQGLPELLLEWVTGLWKIFLVVAIAFLSLVLLNDYIASANIFALQSYLLRPEIIKTVVGGFIGFWMCIRKETVSARLKDLFNGFLGSGEHSPWALQSAAAILFVFMLLGLLRPELLQRIESFKAGELEAHFGSAPSVSSSTLAAIRFSAVDFYRQNGLDGWEDFTAGYVGGRNTNCMISSIKEPLSLDDPANKGVARRNVIAFFGLKGVAPSEEKRHREFQKAKMQAACILFRSYLEPLIKLVEKIEGDEALENLRRDEHFFTPTFEMQRFLLDQNGTDADECRIQLIFSHLASLVVSTKIVLATINGEIPSPDSTPPDYKKLKSSKCSLDSISKPEQVRKDAKFMEENLKIASRNTSTTNPLFEEVLIDPYISNFVGDMLGFFVNNEEEAEFLTKIAAKYPYDDTNIDPGMISIYFSAADAKLRSEFYWPIENIINDLNKANALNETVLNYAADALNDGDNLRNKKEYRDILNRYLQNKIEFDSKYLEIYIQYLLQGQALDSLTDEQRASFKAHFGELQSIVNAVDGDVPIVISGIPSFALKEKARMDWREANLTVSDKFDGEAFLSLAAILLTEIADKAPPEACAAAASYLDKAEEKLDSLVTELISQNGGETTERKKQGLSTVYSLRLKGYLQQFSHRIKVSCS